MESINIEAAFITKENYKKNRKIRTASFLSMIALSIIALIKIHLFLQDPLNNSFLILNISLNLFFLLIIYLFTKANKTNLSAWLLISLYSLNAIFCIYTWTISLAAALLMSLLIITISSILLKQKYAVAISLIFGLTIILLSFLQDYELLKINTNRQKPRYELLEITLYISISSIIVFLVWQRNDENRKNFEQVMLSKITLEHDKQNLKLKIERRTNEILNYKQENLKQLQALASIGHLSSGIFHDIINPLTVVNLNLQQMKNEFQPLIPEAQEFIQQALKSSCRIQELIESANNCLRKKSQQQPFSIQHEILQITKIMASKAKESKVDIKINANEDIYIRGGPARFGQVIMNLIANAIEASKNTRTENIITINIRRETNLKVIVLEIIDQGIGINQENLKNIFSAFFSTKKNSGHNTGIGLSVVKDIIEKDFQGKIDVSSIVNQGTTFKILIPLSYECY